jgi:Rrf2 family protein
MPFSCDLLLDVDSIRTDVVNGKPGRFSIIYGPAIGIHARAVLQKRYAREQANRVRTISKKTKYGLQSLIALARKYGGGPVLISTLAKEEDIPIKFLELILLDLKNHGLLESKKGPGGGYLLNLPPHQITIGSVVRFMEGPLAPIPCASESAYHPCEECEDVDCCGIRILMREVRDAVAGILDATTLQDIVRKVDAAKTNRSAILSYDI